MTEKTKKVLGWIINITILILNSLATMLNPTTIETAKETALLMLTGSGLC